MMRWLKGTFEMFKREEKVFSAYTAGRVWNVQTIETGNEDRGRETFKSLKSMKSPRSLFLSNQSIDFSLREGTGKSWSFNRLEGEVRSQRETLGGIGERGIFVSFPRDRFQIQKEQFTTLYKRRKGRYAPKIQKRRRKRKKNLTQKAKCLWPFLWVFRTSRVLRSSKISIERKKILRVSRREKVRKTDEKSSPKGYLDNESERDELSWTAHEKDRYNWVCPKRA